ncbi:MAG TPA: hypothetical protein VFV87_14285, partial [Pirellulaceae bacterium]|nr:hypothetical protein [Pirellulaceae bacterium]
MSWRRNLIGGGTIIALVLAVIVVWKNYRSPQDRFVEELELVGFSTSMIGGPTAERLDAALSESDRLRVDLFEQYSKRVDSDRRYQLAVLLIERESLEYAEHAAARIHEVPWPEVRIWRIYAKSDSLSAEYRRKIQQLLLASPTSEAKLWAAKWHIQQGNEELAEDCYYSAMTNGLFWDALDAADKLVKSPRYRHDALHHLLAAVAESESFVSRAAFTLMTELGLKDELKQLLADCKMKNADPTVRRALVERLADA